MMYYFETGNKFTVDYGDIDEGFYSSLESMLNRVITKLKTNTLETQAFYLERITDAVNSAQGIGWGYYDCIREMLEEFETECMA